MILEIAEINIKSGQNSEFEKAFELAQKTCLLPATGYIKHNLIHCIETQEHYRILIYWATLEDHTIGFRESDDFAKWRDIIGPYFTEAPIVAHYNI